jgi:hypothetical protein
LGAAGETAGEPDRAHRRLGAARDEAHLLDGGHAGDDLLGEQQLVLARRAEGEPARGRTLHGVEHLGWAWPRIIGPHEQTRST